MNGASPGPGAELANKIARLVEEKGWNQEDFARSTRLNRHTVRQILHGGPKRRLRNASGAPSLVREIGLESALLHTEAHIRWLEYVQQRLTESPDPSPP